MCENAVTAAVIRRRTGWLAGPICCNRVDASSISSQTTDRHIDLVVADTSIFGPTTKMRRMIGVCNNDNLSGGNASLQKLRNRIDRKRGRVKILGFSVVWCDVCPALGILDNTVTDVIQNHSIGILNL